MLNLAKKPSNMPTSRNPLLQSFPDQTKTIQKNDKNLPNIFSKLKFYQHFNDIFLVSLFG
jgi:hypothetical protein